MSFDAEVAKVTVDGAEIPRVLVPETVDELCEALSDLQRDRQRILIVGGGTRLAFGNLGGPYDVVVSTRRLNRILHYEPDDLTLAVEPGCTIAQVHELLGQRGQMLALDAAVADTSTIGGAYAAGLSGPRRFGGGSLKDWTIGVEAAGPSGVVAKAGGMVVKNVTGYDMMHVHHAALGAFGVVTRLNLKVFPSPGPARAVVIQYHRPQDAYAAAIALLRSQLQPSSLIIANRPVWTLRIRCDAPPSAIERLAERVVTTASEAAPPAQVDILADEAQAVAPFIDVTDLRAGLGVARIPVPASQQLPVVELLMDDSVCADLGSGLVYVAGSPTFDWRERVVATQQNPTFLALPATLKEGIDVFGSVRPAAGEVIRRMKQAFDPERLLNPGRFVLHL